MQYHRLLSTDEPSRSDKDLERNENLNLNKIKFSIKCNINCCFTQNITKQVNSLIHLKASMASFIGNCNRYLTNIKWMFFLSYNHKPLTHYSISLLLKIARLFVLTINRDERSSANNISAAIKINFMNIKTKQTKPLATCGINSWLWHKIPAWHKFLLFFLYVILVNVYYQLDINSCYYHLFCPSF